MFEFDCLLQNAFHINTVEMSIPNLEKKTHDENQKAGDSNFAKNALTFFSMLRAIFEDFSDFKKQFD